MKKGNKSIGLALAFILIAGVIITLRPFIRSAESPIRILCLGDSLTESEYGSYIPHLEDFLAQNGIKAVVHSAARPGNNSGEYLKFLRRTDIVQQVHPNHIILLLGTNDVRIDGDHTPISKYSKNLKTIISGLKEIKNPDGSRPTLFLASPPPIFNTDLAPFDATSGDRIKREIVPSLKKLARKSRIQYINLFSFFRDKPELLPGIHPNQKGYRAMGRFIFNALHPYLLEIPTTGEEKLPHPLKGRIAFQSDRNGNEDIFIVSRTGIRQITRSPHHDGYPAFSPDGKNLIFESNRSGKFEIYISDLKNPPKRMFVSSSNDRYPFWTKDGKFIYFARQVGKKDQIFRFNIEKKTIEQITDFKGTNSLPVVSSDGRSMLMTSNKLFGWHVYLVDLQSGNAEKMSAGYGGCRARFSHSDRMIAWVSHKADHKGDIFLTPRDRFSPVRLTLNSQKHDYCPSFSPDDRYIAYGSGPKLKSGNYNIHVVEISTGKIWRITSHPAKDMVPFWTTN